MTDPKIVAASTFALVAAVAAAVAMTGCSSAEGPSTQPANQSATQPTADAADATVILASLEAPTRFASFLTPGELLDLQSANPNLVIVDARKPAEYAAGHIPGAINLPGKHLRTAKAKPGQGDSQYLFRDVSGEIDVPRYEQLLGEAGLTKDTPVVVYGNHAGKGDGTVPAMILDVLGHEDVRFLDGVGLSNWQAAGFEVSTEPTVLPTATYTADVDSDFLWNLDEVLASVGDESVVFYDTRSLPEYDGTDTKRGNARPGHIPGAVRGNYADFLDDAKNLKPRDEVEAILADHGVIAALDEGKTVVMYCQTSTRVSLPYLVLRDLGYDNVAVYDASWHEYGNRDDTPVETGVPVVAVK
ncbi:MAG: rhodanese-like domain-containing protein [Planctomycetota bacterium]